MTPPTHNLSRIAILGSSGFIGKCLVSELLGKGGYEVRVLSRNKERDLREERFGPGVKIFEGDLGDVESLGEILVPGCTVINLVYLWNGGQKLNLICTQNLLAACSAAKVARLIHCSTAAVAGRVSNNLVDEKTQCFPITEYGITKLRIESDIINFEKKNFDTVILRPTSVFGINSGPLKKLAYDLSEGSRWKSYLKSCLFGSRRMNLVHVANVVAAIIYLVQYKGRFDGEMFIVSDDDDPQNNFSDVESCLMRELGIKKYFLPRLPMPLVLLKQFLILMGRNNVNPCCDFDPSKLRKLGFKRPVSLTEGLVEYSKWYRTANLCKKESKGS